MINENYDERQARFDEKERAREQEEREGEVKIGEVTGKTTRDIKREVGGTKIRIDHVEDVYFQPAVDLKMGDSLKITIAADWTKRGKTQHVEFRRRPDNIGEAAGKVTKDIKRTNDVRIRIDGAETLRFKPSTDLKKGDSVRITIEKA
jgi:ribosomal 50S subunit-recycling heat shock protein